MNILLDKRPLDLSADAGITTVGHALEAAKSRLAGTNMLIFGVRCNQQDVSPELLEETLSRPLGSFEDLEFISGHPSDVVLAALNQTRLALADTFSGVRETADALSKGRIPDAMSSLVRCLTVWSQAHEAVVQGGALCRIDFESLLIDGRPMLDWLHDLTRQLRGLKSAIESRDHVLLGDILQYELDEMLRGWERMLDGMIDHIEFRRGRESIPGATITP